MLILLDHGTAVPPGSLLIEQVVKTAKELGWEKLSNGDPLTVAECAGFDILLTTDKNIRYQQNLGGRSIAVVVLSQSRWPVVRL